MHQPNPSEIAAQAAFVQAEAEVGRGVLLPLGGWMPGSERHWTIVDSDVADKYANVKIGINRQTRTNYARLRGYAFHRLILDADDGQIVDHINRNGLDNRRANLRFVTSEENQWNRAKSTGRYTSQYKGVSRKGPNSWQALIYVNNKAINLGTFTTEMRAAWEYDQAALELRGDQARLNGVGGPNSGVPSPNGIGQEIPASSISRILELAQTTANASAIAREVGVSSSTVRRHLRLHGHTVGQTPDEEKPRIIRMALELGVAYAAKEADVAPHTVYSWFHKEGIPLPGHGPRSRKQ